MSPERNRSWPGRMVPVRKTGGGEMSQSRRGFVVGRCSRKNTTYVVLTLSSGPILGPWTLKAVVSSN